MDKIMERYALYSYEQFQLKQPQLKTDGIYRKGMEYYIKCQSLNDKPLNSKYKTVIDSFNHEIRVVSCNVRLVTDLPEGATKVKVRTLKEIIYLSGNPLNALDFNKQLSLIVSKDIPDFWIEFNPSINGWNVKAEKEISQLEKDILIEKINFLSGYQASINFSIEPDIKKTFDFKHQDALSIMVSRHATAHYSKAITEKWEQDEQIWSDNKEKMFTTVDSFETKKDQHSSACLINGTFGEANNIRNYLTLFSELNFVVPIENTYEKFLQSLDINEDELLKLLELSKVKLIFPHSINRYSKRLLEKAAEINPKNIILTRELAYKTIVDLKGRNPFAFLPLTIEEKREILSDLIFLTTISKENKCFEGVAKELSKTWSHMYESLSIRGALGTFDVGLGPIINAMIESLTGKDYFLEIMEASNSIEWAAANNSVLCPVGPLAGNEERLAYLYSGVRKDWNLELVTSPNIATEGILTIANYVPILELAETFTGREIEQFRKMLVDLTHSKSSTEVSQTVQKFNESVKRFERNKKRLDTWDVKGITLDTAMDVANVAIPFSGFITKQLGRILSIIGDRNKGVGSLVQQVESKLYNTSPNVVLVSRMRDKLKDLL